jgi:hypothetical protein
VGLKRGVASFLTDCTEGFQKKQKENSAPSAAHQPNQISPDRMPSRIDGVAVTIPHTSRDREHLMYIHFLAMAYDCSAAAQGCASSEMAMKSLTAISSASIVLGLDVQAH